MNHLLLILTFFLLLICVLISTREYFDLSAAFVDLSTYDELDKYMYN